MKFILNKKDFLRFQLYTASKSKSVRKRKIAGWIIVTSFFIILAILFLNYKDNFLTYYFLIIAILTLVLYPTYIKWVYKRHYSKLVDEYYKNKIEIESEISFTDEFICIIDQSGEVKIKLSEIEEINEIGESLYLKIKNGVSLIFPKNSPDFDEFESELTEVVKKLSIAWNKELNWRWR
jgi:Ca2+/Na+ antiporter